MTTTDPLDALVAAVVKNKYRRVCQELIRHVGARELAARRNLKAAVKATKNKLHQVGGVYFAARMDYDAALDELRQAAGDRERFRRVCRELMARHASTRERADILDEFYRATLSGIGPLRTVLDVACGLNPLAIPWMPLDENVLYYACDVYTDLTAFIGAFLPLAGVRGQAEACDVTLSPPTQRADLALVLKTIPCLEQIDKSAGARLLEQLDAAFLLVSFPAHSLGGRDRGMVENYEAHFRELVRGKPWGVQRFEFEGELAFLVSKE